MGKSIFFSGAGHQKNGFFDDLGVLTSALHGYVMVEGRGVSCHETSSAAGGYEPSRLRTRGAGILTPHLHPSLPKEPQRGWPPSLLDFFVLGFASFSVLGDTDTDRWCGIKSRQHPAPHRRSQRRPPHQSAPPQRQRLRGCRRWHELPLPRGRTPSQPSQPSPSLLPR